MRKQTFIALTLLITLTAAAKNEAGLLTLHSDNKEDRRLSGLVYHSSEFSAIPNLETLPKAEVQASFFFDQYLYTLDMEYLENIVLPYMIDVADALEKTLWKTDSHGFYLVGEDDPTVEVTAAIFFLRDIISTCNILQQYQERVGKWMAMLSKLPPYRIDINEEFRRNLLGEAVNSQKDTDAPHLLGLFFRNDPIIMRNYDVRESCRTSIESTLSRRRKVKQKFDHGLLQLALASAALGDAEKAYTLLRETKMSWSAHDDDKVRKQITPIVLKMLQQSYYSPETNRTYLNLLAATPQAWSKGELKNTLVRGGITMTNMTWDKEEGINATVVSKTDITLDIFIRGKRLSTVELKSGEPYTFTAKKKDSQEGETPTVSTLD